MKTLKTYRAYYDLGNGDVGILPTCASLEVLGMRMAEIKNLYPKAQLIRIETSEEFK